MYGNLLSLFVCFMLVVQLSACKAEEIEALNKEQLLSLPFLVVDLDGDGIEIIPLEESNVYFDVDGDGLAERTAWVHPDDGFLLLISSDDTLEPSLLRQVVIFLTNGMSKLEDFDKNADGKYTSADKISFLNKEVFPLGVTLWQDKNADGYPDDNELVQHVHSENKNLAISHSEGLFLVYGNITQKLSELKFEYEDSNVLWEGLCNKLRSSHGTNSRREYQTRCINQGFITSEGERP